MLSTLLKERKLLLKMAVSDFRSRYTGTALGILWAFIQPLFTFAVYVFVFSVGFKSAPVEGVPYALWLFAGLVPWFYFSDVLTNTAGAVTGYAHLIKKTRFPAVLLPAVRALSSTAIHAVFLALLYAAAALMLPDLNIRSLAALWYSLCALLFASAAGVLAAALSPFLRDVANVIALILQVGFWATPLAWSPEIMSDAVAKLLKLNPAYYAVAGYRSALFGSSAPSLGWTLYFFAVTAAMWAIALLAFSKLRPRFGDAL